VKVLWSGGLEQGYQDESTRFGWICNCMDLAKKDPDLASTAASSTTREDCRLCRVV